MSIPIEYVAGVIDARGHIEMNGRHGRPQPRIRVTTRRVELLQYLAALTGSSVVVDNRGYEKRPCSEHCTDRHTHVARQSAQWTVDSARATVVLHSIRPFVHAQADTVARALASGLTVWPPLRGNTVAQMAALGWSTPESLGVAA